jgi:hypothetical protein
MIAEGGDLMNISAQLQQITRRLLPDLDSPRVESALRLVFRMLGYAGLVALWTWIAMLVIGGLHGGLLPALPAVGYQQAVPVGVIATLIVWLVRDLDRHQPDSEAIVAQTLRSVRTLWTDILAATPDPEAAARQFSGQLGALIALHDLHELQVGRQ